MTSSRDRRPAIRYAPIRLFLATAIALSVAGGAFAGGARGASAAAPGPAAGARVSEAVAFANLEQFANVDLPGELGQTSMNVWVEETGHSIRGYMLDYWRANGAASVYGNPISEPFASPDLHYSQAFEGAIFQFHAELVWTDLPSVGLMPIGDTILRDRLGDFRRDGRRSEGGGDRRTSAWRDLSPAGDSAQRAIQSGGMYDSTTGQTVTGAFYDWYASHEGTYYLGSPVSQPLTERGTVVQYFTGGVLARDTDGIVSVLPIVREHAQFLGVDTTPVDRAGLPVFDELMFWESANPNPLGDPYSTGRKWIEVSIAEQTLRAYHGNTLITSTLISTGLAPNDTEQGLFHVRYKLPEQDMAGATGPNGEVIAMGQDAAEDAAPGQGYTVEDVPNVMYINMDAEALHGAYWHNNFGNPMSHGCINLPLDFASFMYGWAPLGTLVWVHDS